MTETVTPKRRIVQVAKDLNISHRDIKPHNIVRVGNIYKLIDMDVGKSFE